MPKFDPSSHGQPERPRPAPIEFASRWVAWEQAQQSILAHAVTFPELRNAAQSLGYPPVVQQHVPRPARVFIGWHNGR